jgi:uncharacterized glyoxalase superfamily protein PhnB
MNLELYQTFLSVDDHDKALAFYRDALGLEVRNDVSAKGMRWVTVAVPGESTEIVLEPPGTHATDTDREAITRLMAKGQFGRVIFVADDVDAAFERVAATGAEVMQEPTDQPYGVRDCSFRDPAGNVVRISARPSWPS